MKKLFTQFQKGPINFFIKKRIHTDVKLKENLAFKNIEQIPSVTMVRTREQARHVINILKENGNRFHSWDTETCGVDPKEQSPVGNGKIICMSCFAGPDLDFGNGPSKYYIYIIK
jgi:hypothetical protein